MTKRPRASAELLQGIDFVKPLRVWPAFDDREQVRSLIDRHAPYDAIAAHVPDGVADDILRRQAEASVLPWFRGNWAMGGRALVDGAEAILGNRRFIAAARQAFRTSSIHPETVVVNVNAPMPAGARHVDIPAFRGATRVLFPVRLLLAMGASRLFEHWRVIEAGVIAWFYEGAGGAFEYWPMGPDGPMSAEQPPFGNVALVTDSDRMVHRIGRVGEPAAELPRMTAAAKIQPQGGDHWAIVEEGEIRARYPTSALRFSVLWKAEVRDHDEDSDRLDIDRVVATFTADLRRRRIECPVPTDPLHDDAWIAVLHRTYYDPEAALRP